MGLGASRKTKSNCGSRPFLHAATAYREPLAKKSNHEPKHNHYKSAYLGIQHCCWFGGRVSLCVHGCCCRKKWLQRVVYVSEAICQFLQVGKSKGVFVRKNCLSSGTLWVCYRYMRAPAKLILLVIG